MDSLRVLYITGWCRSGSTVLGNLLNELPDAVHVGELHYLWHNGVLRSGTNSTCGCGEELTDCPLWTKVLSRVAGDWPDRAGELATQMVRGQRSLLRTRHAGARLAEATGRRATPAAVVSTVDSMVELYRAIGAVTGRTVVVDSSKYPAEAAALAGRADLDTRVLHLVRDPRATAYSWLRAKGYIPAMSVRRSGAYWTASNAASDRVGAAFPDRYLRLRYEDFAARPAAAVAQVMRFAGLAGAEPVDAAGVAVLGVNHTVTGNPDRLARGTVRIRPDDAWRHALPAREAVLATVLALPLLRRYGYPLR
jgi:Sulfotransferase family